MVICANAIGACPVQWDFGSGRAPAALTRVPTLEPWWIFIGTYLSYSHKQGLGYLNLLHFCPHHHHHHQCSCSCNTLDSCHKLWHPALYSNVSPKPRRHQRSIKPALRCVNHVVDPVPLGRLHSTAIEESRQVPHSAKTIVPGSIPFPCFKTPAFLRIDTQLSTTSGFTPSVWEGNLTVFNHSRASASV